MYCERKNVDLNEGRTLVSQAVSRCFTDWTIDYSRCAQGFGKPIYSTRHECFGKFPLYFT